MSADPTNMHVITENGEQCFMWRSNQLTYIAQDRQELPQVLATKFGPLATKLDLSYNTLTSFKNINMFTNLSELILDNNYLEDAQLDFKQNLRLKTLSLNKNKLTNLHKLVISVKVCFPNLEFLSLIGNPLCPMQVWSSLNNLDTNQGPLSKGGAPTATRVNGVNKPPDNELNENAYLTAHVIHNQQTEFVYQKYRYFIIYHLPNLRFLDSSPISNKERDEALKRCFWMKSINESENLTATHNGKPVQTYTASGKLDDNHNHNNTFSERMSQITCDSNTNTNSNGNTNTNDNQQASFPLSVMSTRIEGANQAESNQESQPKGAFSRLSYKYTGKNSEGNRFIRNRDL